MPLSVFNVLHPPLGARRWRPHRPPGSLTLTATTSCPLIGRSTALNSGPVTTYVSLLSKKGAGTRPWGPWTQLSHATPAKTAMHQAALITPDRLQAGTNTVLEANKQKKKENTNIAWHELFLHNIRMYWKSLAIPSPIFCLCGKYYPFLFHLKFKWSQWLSK